MSKLATHSFFAPSAAHRWIPCPGSMAMPENQIPDKGSEYADDGTASHQWSALCLESSAELDAASLIGSVQEINGKTYTMDAERAEYCQVYIDDVRRRAIGGRLWIEYHIDLSDILGDGQGGTADAGIYIEAEKHLIIEDLKYGQGERVWSKTLDGKPNFQLALYALGFIRELMMLDLDVEKVTLVVCQPRLNHIDEFTLTVAELREFAERARLSVLGAKAAMAATPEHLPVYLNPGESQCRWCRAQATCPALAKQVTDELGEDFDLYGVVPAQADKLAKAFAAIPMIEMWIKAVKAEVGRLVADGQKVIGPDGEPYKYVDGDEGKRQWADPAQAEAALLGQLPPEKVYERKLITAPAAAKLLDKKATKALWNDLFVPLIKRARNAPQLVMGSDSRPPVSAPAEATEFEDALTE